MTNTNNSENINANTPLPLLKGGTSASLTASNGGILYSTASAAAILAGTATAGKIVMSGATAAPTWSTSTYPATNAVSTLLYASSANVMGALATANSSGLLTNGSGVPSWVTVTGTGAPVLATSPTLVTPVLGTPASGNLSSCTGYPANSGQTLQVVSTITGAVATGSTIIPADDTIPQSNEGNQYMSLAITPSNSSNYLLITVVCTLTSSAVANNHLVCALFQDSTANALASAVALMPLSAGMMNIKFQYIMTAGTTSATTFKVRAGCPQTGTTTFNGSGSARFFGGSIASSISIVEYHV